MGYRGNNARQPNEAQGNNMNNLINFSDWINDDSTFIGNAKRISIEIKNVDGDNKTSKGQLRKYFDVFVRATENCQRGMDVSPEIFKIQMLLPHISYQSQRRSPTFGTRFAQFLQALINYSANEPTPEKLTRAKFLFEAVYGFYGEGKQ